MGFKLVRVDAEEPNKIQLAVGTHLIGRGKFLDCEDKRISRNHGNLIVSDDSVTIEALHQNPCFFTRKGSNDTQVLKKSCAETLDNGDRFGLLPGSYWYEVLQCTTATDCEATDVATSQEQKTGVGETNDCANDRNDHDELNETIQTTQLASDGNANSGVKVEDNDNEKVLDFDLNETADNVRGESPSLLDQENQEQASNQPSNEPGPSGTPHQPNEPETTDSVPKSPSPKRSHSPDVNEGVKKIKTEPVEVHAKQELLVKQELEDPTAGPSNDQAGASNSASDAGKAPPSPAKPPNRERCMYGADCYRRNPQHKAQFAHPLDADWGSGARAPCPYGAACRKRDPRHHALHDHPPHVRPPPPRAQIVERHGNVYYINARTVNFYDDHLHAEGSDGDSADIDYEF